MKNPGVWAPGFGKGLAPFRIFIIGSLNQSTR